MSCAQSEGVNTTRPVVAQPRSSSSASMRAQSSEATRSEMVAVEAAGVAVLGSIRTVWSRSLGYFTGWARGWPFSTTYVTITFAGVVPVFLPSCGFRTSIWYESPALRCFVGSPSTIRSSSPCAT